MRRVLAQVELWGRFGPVRSGDGVTVAIGAGYDGKLFQVGVADSVVMANDLKLWLPRLVVNHVSFVGRPARSRFLARLEDET